jgi:hypothetical protein
MVRFESEEKERRKRGRERKKDLLISSNNSKVAPGQNSAKRGFRVYDSSLTPYGEWSLIVIILVRSMYHFARCWLIIIVAIAGYWQMEEGQTDKRG